MRTSRRLAYVQTIPRRVGAVFRRGVRWKPLRGGHATLAPVRAGLRAERGSRDGCLLIGGHVAAPWYSIWALHPACLFPVIHVRTRVIGHPPPERIVIATRASRLALWQAEHVRTRLRALYPACRVELLELTTRGDRILDRPLAQIGGKGLFIKELEVALRDGRADVAVHSMKDLPGELDAGFRLVAICEREDPRDALVGAQAATLDDLPRGARIGTSSLRRSAQLGHRYPHLEFRPLRGNLDTRLGKLDAGEYDALVLAAAGLRRLGLSERISSVIPVDISLPAVGQGALGIEALAERSDVAAWVAPLGHADTARCVVAERSLSRSLSGNCEVPLGGYAEMLAARPGQARLRGVVASRDGAQLLYAEATGDDPERLGDAVATQLRALGADALLAARV